MTDHQTQESGMPELLPCPFCGAAGKMISVYYCDHAKRWKAGCGPCGTHVGITPRKENEWPDVLAKRWNTRAALATPAVTPKAAREALEWVDVKISEHVEMYGEPDPFAAMLIGKEKHWTGRYYVILKTIRALLTAAAEVGVS